MGIEDHIQRIRQISDNLRILGHGIANIYPEADNAIGIMSDILREEADAIISLLYDEKSGN